MREFRVKDKKIRKAEKGEKERKISNKNNACVG